MLGKIVKNQKALYFLGGVVSATLGVKFLKSETSRKLCVQGMAKGMRLQKDAMETFQNMKEEVADICHDAKEQSGATE